jgi:hypothetical protein
MTAVGPRITRGKDSKQDYATPAEFIAAVEKRFGPIQFDLAAHRANKRHERYFAPLHFVEPYDPEKPFDAEAMLASLVDRGARLTQARYAIQAAQAGRKKTEITVENHDPDAHAFDAFKQDWAPLSKIYPAPYGGPGLLWLNCEFSDISPWAARCALEMRAGASIVLLTPAMVGANWNRDHILGLADVYDLSGRISFDGKNPYPKDCQLAHFHTNATGLRALWDWRGDRVVKLWRKAA